MHPLPKPSVDTGMGLERIAAVLQGSALELRDRSLPGPDPRRGARNGAERPEEPVAQRHRGPHPRLRRSSIVDGVIPGNEGRGYVLRRIIRRAIRHGYKLGQKQPFFHRLVEDLDQAMGDAYPELRHAEGPRWPTVLKQEEERFAETLENGMGVLESALASGEKLLDGETVFKLYDTFGFPVDLTADIGRERGVRDRHARASRRRWRSSASARARRRKFSMAAGLEYSGGEDRVPRLRHARRLRPGSSRSIARARRCEALKSGDDRHRGARPHAVLRRVRRPGRRPRRARRLGRHLRGRRHAEDPGRRVRAPRAR